MKLLLPLLLVFAATAALAHPPVGVVIDSRGNVYYSDLEQVWRITPAGEKSVAVPRVHTHELYLDAHDNLYGEHLWYEGDATKKWGYYVWVRQPDGQVRMVVPRTEGFRSTWSFVRDAAGNMYSANRERNEIVKRTPEGRVVVVARARFRDIRWMTATPDGTVYLIDSLDLIRIAIDGKVATVAHDITKRSLVRPMAERHLLMGLWTDRSGNVYVADGGAAVVKRFDRAGNVRVVAESAFPWFPTGGAFAANGDLWLLEATMTNQVRVRRIKNR